jgi:glutamine amidotransferase PdxT
MEIKIEKSKVKTRKKLSSKWTIEIPQVTQYYIDHSCINELLKELAVVRQKSELSFIFFPELCSEIVEWLNETSFNYVEEISEKTESKTITFDDKQGAIEFKLRFT